MAPDGSAFGSDATAQVTLPPRRGAPAAAAGAVVGAAGAAGLAAGAVAAGAAGAVVAATVAAGAAGALVAAGLAGAAVGAGAAGGDVGAQAASSPPPTTRPTRVSQRRRVSTARSDCCSSMWA